MVRRPNDDTLDPAGGHAAERLRMFEEARKPVPPETEKNPESGEALKNSDVEPKGDADDDKHTGRPGQRGSPNI